MSWASLPTPHTDPSLIKCELEWGGDKCPGSAPISLSDTGQVSPRLVLPSGLLQLQNVCALTGRLCDSDYMRLQHAHSTFSGVTVLPEM